MASPQHTHNPMDPINRELFEIGLEQLKAGEYQGAIETFLDLQAQYPDDREVATRLRQARCLARFPFLRPFASLGDGWVCKSPMNLVGLAAVCLVAFIAVVVLVYQIPVPPFPGPTESPTTVVIVTTEEPTEEPTKEPTEEPTAEPTEEPTKEPIEEPTAEPTEEPTKEPIEEPTAEPTEEPTKEPTEEPVPVAPPAAPTNIQVVSSTETSVTLSWNNAGGQIKVVVQRNGHGVAELPANSQSYTDNDLVCGRSFDYKIVAVNEAGESKPAQITAQTMECSPTAQPVPPEPPPLTGKIAVPVFDTEAGAYNVYIAQAKDGWQPKLFFENGSQPAFSTDGQQIILRSWRQAAHGGCGQRLVLFPSLETADSDARRMTHNLEDAHPSLSRSGEIVFHSRRKGSPVLFVLGTWPGAEEDREKQAELAPGENPDWLGNRIVYYAYNPPGLYIRNADGSIELVLSEQGPLTPSAAPDNDHVAVSLKRGGYWHVFVLSVSQGESSLTQLTNESADDQLPVWSPDGQSIAFVSNRERSCAVWVMNADGTNQRKLFDLDGPIDGTVSLAPDMSFGWGEEQISWAP